MSTNIEVPSVKLTNDENIPMVGLGTFKTENQPEKLANAVKEAIKCGYRHFDCAFAYQNEDVIGKALHEAINESNGKINRDDLFVTTKLWNTFHSKEQAIKAVDMQLKNFGFSYFDLYLMHWPMGYAEDTGSIFPTNEKGELLSSDVHYIDTYKALEKIYECGKAKNIGVCNFNLQQLKDLLDHCNIKPAVLQIEIHPYLQNNQLIEFCHQNEIAVIAYCPLGASDRSWKKSSDPILLEDEVITKLAKKYNKTNGQICLRWNTQRNVIVIPKSVTPSRIKENINIFDFKLSDEDMKEIKKLDKGFRYYLCEEAIAHIFHPFR